MTATDFTPAPVFRGLTNLPDPMTVASAIPRQELFFPVLAGDIPLTTGGNDQDVRVTCSLPLGYSYVLTEIHAGIAGADVDQWATISECQVTDSVDSATYRAKFSSNITVPMARTTQFRMTYNFSSLLKRVIIPAKDGAELIWVTSSANNVDLAAAILNFTASFLVYDIAQANHFELNTPVYTR